MLQGVSGFGLSVSFVQTRTIRDTAAMLDCMAIPQVGDPFSIPKPDQPYAVLAGQAAKPLRVGVSCKPLMGVPVDPEVAAAVQATAKVLEGMGHEIVEIDPQFEGQASVRKFSDVATDLNCVSPQYFNIRHPDKGVMVRESKKKKAAAAAEAASSPVDAGATPTTPPASEPARTPTPPAPGRSQAPPA